MSKSRKVNPTANQLDVSAAHADLQRAIQSARAELADRSEAEIASLWDAFEILLNTWRAQGEGYAPVVRRDPRMRHGGNARPDYVETFVQLTNQRFVLLPRFIRSLDRKVRLGLIKALALLVLREAAEGNSEGALRASVLFNKAFAEFLIASGGGPREQNRMPARASAAKQGKGRQGQNAREAPLKSSPAHFAAVEPRET
jgi:hypothetical protein